MTILHRYIAKTVILASLIVILAVLGVVFLVGLLSEMRDMGVGDYGFSQVVIHVLMKIPHDLYLFFPMLLLIGGVLGLGMLSTHHELIVMRSSGVSIKKVISAVITAAVILIIFATIMGECIAPRALFLADKRKETAESNGQAVATATGLWVHVGNNFLHVDHVIGHNHLEGVKRYEFDGQHHLLAAYFVKSMDYQHGTWQLHEGVKTTLGNDLVHSQGFADGRWNLAVNPSLLDIGLVEPEELSLPDLTKYSHYLLQNGLQANRFQFEFWKRVFQPLTTIVMILLAVPFVFGAPRSTTMGRRILFGVMMGFVFYILNAFLGQFSIVFQISPVLAALLPTLLFAGLGYFFMARL